MSQNAQALEKVKKLSGMEDLVLRPLSAKLLPPSRAELMGWVDREKLLDINGRSRHRQMELMNSYGLVEYPSPGGGCLLTDPGYSSRLKVLEDDGLLKDEHSWLFKLIKEARFFRFDKGRYLFVGRDKESNMKIDEYRKEKNLKFYIHSAEVPGPHLIANTDLSDEEIEFAKNLFSRYSKVKGNEKINLNNSGNIETVDIVDLKKLDEEIKKYQQL